MATDCEQSFGEAGEQRLVVDGHDYQAGGPIVSGREVLEIADKRPVDDFIVYWLGRDNVLMDLGLDKTVHLEHQGVQEFFTFQSDRSFRFEIEGKREDWGAPKITEETLRKLAGVGTEFRIWLDRKDGPDRLIERGEVVDLAAPGTERFYMERVITITVVNEEDGHEFQLEGLRHTMVEALIAEMYVKLKVPRRDDDRLRCEQTGGDVFAFASRTLGQYLDEGHCHCLVWLFVGGTGGA